MKHLKIHRILKEDKLDECGNINNERKMRYENSINSRKRN